MRPNRTRLNHPHAVARWPVAQLSAPKHGPQGWGQTCSTIGRAQGHLSRQSAQSALPWRRAAIHQRDEAAWVQRVGCASPCRGIRQGAGGCSPRQRLPIAELERRPRWSWCTRASRRDDELRAPRIRIEEPGGEATSRCRGDVEQRRSQAPPPAVASHALQHAFASSRTRKMKLWRSVTEMTPRASSRLKMWLALMHWS